MKPSLHLIRLKEWSIYQQLQLEEALLRLDQRNWCIVQDGTSPAIVMGISGKPELHVAPNQPFPLIRRYSGGGTVVVDHDTAFISFICQSEALSVAPLPDPIFAWSKELYADIFEGHPFDLRERDYVFHDRKFGGNAQYLTKDRWVHHSTLLWDYRADHMDYLQMPQRRPEYRLDRAHSDFLTSISRYLPTRLDFWERVENALHKRFKVVEVDSKDVLPLLEQPHRKATQKTDERG